MSSLKASSNLTLGELTLEQLAFRSRAGSLPMFVELVSRMEGRVFNFVLRRVRCRADAEDLTQETFLRAWRNIATYRKVSSVSTWLFTIASRLAIDHLRREGSEIRAMNALKSSRDMPPDPTLKSDSQDAGAELWRLASTMLSDEQHSALWLRYAEGLSVKEVASVLGRTQIAVRVMLHRARNILSRHAGNGQSHSKSSGAVNRLISQTSVESEKVGVACP